MNGGPVARVLVDSPLPQLDQLFDYAVPDRLDGAAVAGVRVRVPLGRAAASPTGGSSNASTRASSPVG